jgi:hypothetical protein
MTHADGARTGKMDPASDPRHPQPEGVEVESARLLEMQALERPEVRGFDRDDLRALADEFIALDLGEDLEAFLRWVQERRSREAASDR